MCVLLQPHHTPSCQGIHQYTLKRHSPAALRPSLCGSGRHLQCFSLIGMDACNGMLHSQGLHKGALAGHPAPPFGPDTHTHASINTREPQLLLPAWSAAQYTITVLPSPAGPQ
jgi:hypothetical protein